MQCGGAGVFTTTRTCCPKPYAHTHTHTHAHTRTLRLHLDLSAPATLSHMGPSHNPWDLVPTRVPEAPAHRRLCPSSVHPNKQRTNSH